LPCKRRSIPRLDCSLEKPLVALQSATSGGALIKAVFALLKRAAPCDFVTVCLRIFRRENRNIAYRILDSRERTFGIDLLEGSFFEAHPGMPILMANPGIKFINTREVLPHDEEALRQMPFYRDVMQVIGFRHAVGMFFWERPPQTPEAIFSLYRNEGQPDFNDEEVAVLTRLYPHIGAALRRHRIMERERAAYRALRLGHRTERAVCLLNWNLSVADANCAARELCALWNLGTASARLKPPPFELPAQLREVCSELKAHWRTSLRRSPAAGASKRITVKHPRRPSLTAIISLRAHRSDPIGKPQLAVAFEQSVALPSRRTKHPFLLRTLAPRERDLVRLVAAGKSNQEIATETGKALGSVKNALHAVFRKVGVRRRSALVAQIGTL
jgi:DNA-binding CsgD family transcriptional regulator